MPMYDPLFAALAQAESLPSHAYRDTQAALNIPGEALSGYTTGLQARSQIDQYKLLNTPLGSMYSDPSQIPFGLGPQHTVKDLLTIAPAMENYVPSNILGGAAGAFGANVSSGGGGSAPPSAPAQPVPGSQNPPQSPGAAALASTTGTGAGGGANLPPGAPTTLNLPPGGMSMKGFQNVVLPALRAGQEERQFQQKQGAEESRFERGQAAEESRFGRGKMAGVAEEAAKNLANTGSIQDDINTLRGLYKGYSPVPFMGAAGAALTAASGSPTFGTKTMQQGNRIQQVTPGLGAKINYELTHRFSPGESQLLMAKVAPTATDNEANATLKLNNLQRLTSVFQSGDQQSISMVSSAIAGQPVVAKIPTSKSEQVQTQKNPNISKAQQWLQQNPNNPKAAAVRARLLAMQNGQ